MKVNFMQPVLVMCQRRFGTRYRIIARKIRLRSIISRAPGLLWSASTNSGYVNDAKPAMKSLIETLEVNDYPIISPAGSCTYAIKGYPSYLPMSLNGRCEPKVWPIV